MEEGLLIFWTIYVSQNSLRVVVYTRGQLLLALSLIIWREKVIAKMSTRRWVQALFAPRGVAVVGAALQDPARLGWGTLRAVSRNPHRRQRPVVALEDAKNNENNNNQRWTMDLDDQVASDIDLAVLVSSRDHCLDRMRQCIARFPELQVVNVVSGGFRETKGGQDLEMQMVQEARAAGIRLIGPNSVGSIDAHHDFASMFLRTFPQPGGLSLISQSGGVCGAVVELLSQQQPSMGMSKVVSLGNAADVGFVEMLEAVAEDPETRVVLLYLEGLGSCDDGEEFVRVAKLIAQDKPIIALKAGSSHAAARAISSHTGALAGNRRVYEAALRAAGIVQATTLRNMLDLAQTLSCRPRVAFSETPPPSAAGGREDRKYRVAVITNAGGPSALTVDALLTSGAATVPCLPDSVQNDIRHRKGVHKLSATSNPIDLLGGATPQGYVSAMEAALLCHEVDAVVPVHVPTALSNPKDLATAFASVHSSKPIVSLFVSTDREYMDAGLSVLQSSAIPTFVHTDGVGEAFRAWKEREDLLHPESRAGDDTLLKPLELSDSQLAQCAEFLSGLEHGWVMEHDARTLLELIEIEQPKAALVPSASPLEDVLAASERIGFPVVLKRQDSVHKSRRTGGVALNLQNRSHVQAALRKMFPDQSSTAAPVLVCEYVAAASSDLHSTREYLVGAVRDEVFGPAVCFGMGGVLVEVMGDVAFALPPASRSDTMDLLRRVRLSDHRLNLSVVADTVEKIAALAKAFPIIAELDINPLIVNLSEDDETRVVAADVKFRLDP